jgi:hypothetical protein
MAPDNLVFFIAEFLPDREHRIEIILQRRYGNCGIPHLRPYMDGEPRRPIK